MLRLTSTLRGVHTFGSNGALPATTRIELPQVWASTQKKVRRVIEASFLEREAGDREGRYVDERFPAKEEVANNLAGRRALRQAQMPMSECIDDVGTGTGAADYRRLSGWLAGGRSIPHPLLP